MCFFEKVAKIRRPNQTPFVPPPPRNFASQFYFKVHRVLEIFSAMIVL